MEFDPKSTTSDLKIRFNQHTFSSMMAQKGTKSCMHEKIYILTQNGQN